MRNMINRKYVCTKIDHKFLVRNGFRFLRSENSYICSFPVDKHNGEPTLFCEVMIYEDGDVKIDLFTQNRYFYSQFYNYTNNGYNEYMNKINKKIECKLEQFSIKEKKTKKRRTK